MFQATRAAAMQYTGVAVHALATHSPEYWRTIIAASTSIEARHPQIIRAEVQGSHPHKSSNDPSDPKEVVTVSYFSSKGSRLLSIHAHDDGTWKEFPSRTGKRIGHQEYEGSSAESSQSQQAGHTWQLNPTTQVPEAWHEGTWVPATYQEAHKKWMAYLGNQWYPYPY